jgi:hypothetical protein
MIGSGLLLLVRKIGSSWTVSYYIKVKSKNRDEFFYWIAKAWLVQRGVKSRLHKFGTSPSYSFPKAILYTLGSQECKNQEDDTNLPITQTIVYLRS